MTSSQDPTALRRFSFSVERDDIEAINARQAALIRDLGSRDISQHLPVAVAVAVAADLTTWGVWAGRTETAEAAVTGFVIACLFFAWLAKRNASRILRISMNASFGDRKELPYVIEMTPEGVWAGDLLREYYFQCPSSIASFARRTTSVY